MWQLEPQSKVCSFVLSGNAEALYLMSPWKDRVCHVGDVLCVHHCFMCMFVAQLCLSLCDPMDCSPPSPLFMDRMMAHLVWGCPLHCRSWWPARLEHLWHLGPQTAVWAQLPWHWHTCEVGRDADSGPSMDLLNQNVHLHRIVRQLTHTEAWGLILVLKAWHPDDLHEHHPGPVGNANVQVPPRTTESGTLVVDPPCWV